MSFEQTVQQIKSLEIQGARNIALAAVQAFAKKLQETQDKQKLLGYAKILMEARATEPALRNALRYCLENYQKDSDIIAKVLKHFAESREKINLYGQNKISGGMKIFTHCHSSTVTAIMIAAKKQGKKFSVFNTETRPRFQGRETATELSQAGIPVEHFVDSAGRQALKNCDLFLFGCDAITAEGGIINKIGTHMFVDFANDYNIPAYTCTDSWKFNPETVHGLEEKIEQRDAKEVWENPPKDIKIHNPAFEITPADKITGIISELGVMKTESLIMAIKEAYPWMI